MHDEVLKKLWEEVKNFYRDRLVSFAVFGSVARGLAHPHSDIDCLIVCENLPRGRMKRIREFSENVEEKLEDILTEAEMHGYFIEISPIIKTPAEVKKGGFIYLDMTEEVKILYDKDMFLRNFLTELKEKLQRWGARKVPFMGGYYWVLKENVNPSEGVDI